MFKKITKTGFPGNESIVKKKKTTQKENREIFILKMHIYSMDLEARNITE